MGFGCHTQIMSNISPPVTIRVSIRIKPLRGTLGEATAREGYILCFLCFKIREVKLDSDRLTCGVVHDGKGFLCVFHDSIFKVIKGFDSPSRHSYFLI